MPYIFPRRQLADGDILDPIDMNEDFVPVVELYSGKLNEHNFVETGSAGLPTLGDGNIEANAYYTFIDEKKVVDPDFGTPPGPFAMAQLTNITEPDKVTNDVGWSAIPLNASGDTFVTTTSNSASVWVEALIQYAVSPETFPAAIYSGITRTVGGQYRGPAGDVAGARIQFALRVDGSVLPWTITGHENPFHTSPRGEKPSVAYQISSDGELLANAPGPKIEQDSDLGMLGNFYYPVRLGSLIDLTAGSHTIELVARRLPRVDQTLGFDPDDIISIYTRRLFAVEIPQMPRASSTFDSVEVTPFDSESLLSQTAFEDSVDATRDKMNAIQDGALARAALRGDLLPSATLGSTTTDYDSATLTQLNATFPGWGASTLVGSDPGWTAAPISGTVTATLTTAGQTAKVLLMADVHVADLVRQTSDGQDRDILGAIAIAVSTDGGSTYTVQEDSIVWFNNTNGLVYLQGAFTTDRYARANMNIATMTVLGVTSTTTYDYQIVGCVVPTAAANPNQMRTQRGTISAIVLRD